MTKRSHDGAPTLAGRAVARTLAHAALLAACATDSPPDRPDVDELLRSFSPALASIAERASEHRLQVLIAEIVEAPGGSRLVRHGFRVDAEYFYPASAIKTFAAIAALQWVEEQSRERPGLDLATPLVYHPLFEDETLEEADPTNLEGGRITVGHEIRKLSLVSDNRAFNRLYELIGHEELHTVLWASGFDSVRVHHRLSEFRGWEDQVRTPRVTVLVDGAPFTMPARESGLRVVNADLTRLSVGEAHIRGGERIAGPMEFDRKNRVSLVDLQDMLIALVRPDVDLSGKSVPLREDLREFLLRAMTEFPAQSSNPIYDPDQYPDDWVKFLLPGIVRVIPINRLRIVNKVGRAYGFSVENAYVEDRETGRGVFVAAVLYTNPNRVVNDGKYGYESFADPFFADLGEAVARGWLFQNSFGSPSSDE